MITLQAGLLPQETDRFFLNTEETSLNTHICCKANKRNYFHEKKAVRQAWQNASIKQLLMSLAHLQLLEMASKVGPSVADKPGLELPFNSHLLIIKKSIYGGLLTSSF